MSAPNFYRRVATMTVAAGLLSCAVIPAPAAAHVGMAAQASLRPTADAHVVRAAPQRIHGRATTLRVGPSRATRAYLRFALPAGEVRTAALRVYTRARTRGRLVVRSVRAGGRWTERRLRRRPALGRVLAVSPRLEGRGWTVLDVTRAARSRGRIELALLPRRGARIPVASRESSRSPRMVVDGGSAVPSPQPGVPGPSLPAPPAPVAKPPVIAGAGDIADDERDAEATARLLDALNPEAVLTTGDNAYPDGTAEDYSAWYAPTWGRHKAITRPVPGNHEYHTPGASAYFEYFGPAAADPAKGYYAYDLGAWRLYALNSNVSVSSSSAQTTWLKADLAANPRACVLAYWHHPRFSAGSYADDVRFQPLWQALHDAGADVVLAGHDHNYQRYVPMRPDGTVDRVGGIRQFVIGMGGTGHYSLATRADGRREAGDDTTFGVLALTLRPTGYDWRFVPEAGRTFSDSGADDCH